VAFHFGAFEVNPLVGASHSGSRSHGRGPLRQGGRHTDRFSCAETNVGREPVRHGRGLLEYAYGYRAVVSRPALTVPRH